MASVEANSLRGPSRRMRGQTLVEFALTFPFFLGLVLLIIQLSVIILQQLSLMWVTRETARWLALRPDTVDSAAVAYARAHALALDPDRIVSVVPSPACPNLDTSGICPLRPTTSLLSVEITYDLSSRIFLPTSFSLGGLTVAVRTSLPPYKISILME